jgi:hypothetical protein
MNLIAQTILLLKSCWRWYHSNFMSAQLIRVDPITILALIGMATTAWGIGRGLGAMDTANSLADGLRNAPIMLNQQVSQAHKSGQISGYDREVALQRVEMMVPIFNQYADIIQARGDDLEQSALLQGIVESLASLGPGQGAGRLVGDLSTGKGFDLLVGLAFIKNSIEEFELVGKPFAGEEAALREQIKTIMGSNADRLFLARMRHKINWAKSKWEDLKKEYPDDPGKAEQYLRWEVYNRATT